MSEIIVKREYYENGKLFWEFPYNKNNQLHGLKKYWSSDGKIWCKVQYQNGKQHGIGWFYKNGKLSCKKYYLYNFEVSKEEYRKYKLIEKLACLK